MKTKSLMLFHVAGLLSLTMSCVPIDPNWTPEQKAKVQNSNAQVAQGVGIGLLGAGAALWGASELRNSGNGYWYGGHHYYNRDYRHGRYFYY
jgi:hypothetical protein